MFRFAVSLVACASLAAAHTVIVYPGWRGNNIHTNGTVSTTDSSIKPGSIGINYEGNDTYGFPYGMQWMYPCTFCLVLSFPYPSSTMQESDQDATHMQMDR